MGPPPYRQCTQTTHIGHSVKTNSVPIASKFCTVIIFATVDVQTTKALFINMKCFFSSTITNMVTMQTFSHCNDAIFTPPGMCH
jgi:hypothetical protein